MGISTFRVVPLCKACPDLMVNLNSPIVPVTLPKGSILKLVRVGSVLMVTDIPVLTVVVGAVGCEMLTLNEPEAASVGGFFS